MRSKRMPLRRHLPLWAADKHPRSRSGCRVSGVLEVRNSPTCYANKLAIVVQPREVRNRNIRLWLERDDASRH
jgi:hypothetical protein